MNAVTTFFEKLFYNPGTVHKFLSLLLLPLSFIYGSIVYLRRKFAKKIDYGINIISVGNLTVGGTGKTPFIIFLANRYENCAVITRGYGRQSKGLYLISDGKNILQDCKISGDEAMEIAQATDAVVIVSEDRDEGIKKAKSLNTTKILLDDGFSKVGIKKYDILLFPPLLQNRFPLPSGPLREFYSMKKHADLCLQEGEDFHRVVTIKNPTRSMVLVTAIANPTRLDPFLPQDLLAKIYYPDHAYFDQKQLEDIMKRYGATSLLVTQKDLVKIDFSIELSIMQLQLDIAQDKLLQIDNMV